MPVEKDNIIRRYGLIEQGKAEMLPEAQAPEGLVVRVFAKDEDIQWRIGILMTRDKNKGLNPNMKRANRAEVAKLDKMAAQARREGKVPFRVVGPKTVIPGFLEEARIAEVEFVA